MPRITIDAEGCKSCGLCIEFCPRKVITISPKLNSRGHHPALNTMPENCIGCSICATMCPDVCIEVFREKKAKKP